MRTVEYATLPKQLDQHARAFTFFNLSAQLNEKRLNLPPLDIGTDGAVVEQLQCFFVFALHNKIVLLIDTVSSLFFGKRIGVWRCHCEARNLCFFVGGDDE